MASVLSANEYKASFKPLPAIRDIPTYDTLRTLRQILKANAATVTSTNGGGAHGYVGLVVTAAAYDIIAPGTPFNVPVNPPAEPVIAAGATGAQIGEAVRQHKEQRRVFSEYTNVQQALKTQVEEAIDDIYLVGIVDLTTGLANVTLTELLNHLMTTYGGINDLDLKANTEEMMKEWDQNTPVEFVIRQIERAREFAADALQPYTDAQALTIANNLIAGKSLFVDPVKEWNRKDAADKTWTNFKTHYIQAQKEIRQNKTMEEAGYHGANASIQETEQQNQAEALMNLAAAVSSDRQTFSDMTNTIQTLLAKNAALEARLDALAKNTSGGPTNDRRQTRRPPDPNGYCSTHGYYVAEGHNSKTCRTPGPNHNLEATRENNMGGSQKGKK